MSTQHAWAVLWDVDGTLVDTGDLHFQAWSALTREQNLPFSRADFEATFGWRNVEIIPHLFGVRDPRQVASLGDRKEDLYRAAAKQGVTLLPGARALLAAIHEAGGLQAIGSSAPRANVDLIAHLTRIRPWIQAIVAMEDTERGKPDPEVFLLAAQRLGIAPERCVVFEDAPVGVLAAKAGGMRCVAVRHLAHHSVARLADAGADRIVSSLAELNVRDVKALLG